MGMNQDPPNHCLTEQLGLLVWTTVALVLCDLMVTLNCDLLDDSGSDLSTLTTLYKSFWRFLHWLLHIIIFDTRKGHLECVLVNIWVYKGGSGKNVDSVLLFQERTYWKCRLIASIYACYNIQNISFHHFPFDSGI
jgi:hypothetical protein